MLPFAHAARSTWRRTPTVTPTMGGMIRCPSVVSVLVIAAEFERLGPGCYGSRQNKRLFDRRPIPIRSSEKEVRN